MSLGGDFIIIRCESWDPHHLRTTAVLHDTVSFSAASAVLGAAEHRLSDWPAMRHKQPFPSASLRPMQCFKDPLWDILSVGERGQRSGWAHRSVSLEPASILSQGQLLRRGGGRSPTLEVWTPAVYEWKGSSPRSPCHPAASNRCLAFTARLFWQRYDPNFDPRFIHIMSSWQPVRKLKDVNEALLKLRNFRGKCAIP